LQVWAPAVADCWKEQWQRPLIYYKIIKS